MTTDGAAPRQDLEADEELSIRQAVQYYQLSRGSLEQRLRIGEIKARKVRGSRSMEWRVRVGELQACGYVQRESPLEPGSSSPQDRVRDLSHTLSTLRSLEAALGAELRRCAKQQHKLEVMHQQVTSLMDSLSP